MTEINPEDSVFYPPPKTKRGPFRRKHIPLRILVPNAITISSMCCALAGIRYALIGELAAAIAAVILATVLDGLDGRVARLLKGTSPFGANLDSLADAVNFGVTPAIILYVWSSPTLGAFAWLVLMAYVVCIAIRLARFNSQIGADTAVWQKNFFSGVPAPAGAMLVMVPAYLSLLGVPASAAAALVAPYTPVVAWLCVSTIPTFSGKLLGGRVGAEHGAVLLVCVAVVVSVGLVYPWITLLSVSALYAASIPFSIRSHRRHSRNVSVSRAGSKDSDELATTGLATDSSTVTSTVSESRPKPSGTSTDLDTSITSGASKDDNVLTPTQFSGKK